MRSGEASTPGPMRTSAATPASQSACWMAQRLASAVSSSLRSLSRSANSSSTSAPSDRSEIGPATPATTASHSSASPSGTGRSSKPAQARSTLAG
ncbi:hypothetical protein ACFQQB_17335 [Nonomuraea rubra]|uniref:hypothetical protein n=1 Tax=Nonomuraea rubra TaxID=46180 RepID=UPI0036242B08